MVCLLYRAYCTKYHRKIEGFVSTYPGNDALAAENQAPLGLREEETVPAVVMKKLAPAEDIWGTALTKEVYGRPSGLAAGTTGTWL